MKSQESVVRAIGRGVREMSPTGSHEYLLAIQLKDWVSRKSSLHSGSLAEEARSRCARQ